MDSLTSEHFTKKPYLGCPELALYWCGRMFRCAGQPNASFCRGLPICPDLVLPGLHASSENTLRFSHA